MAVQTFKFEGPVPPVKIPRQRVYWKYWYRRETNDPVEGSVIETGGRRPKFWAVYRNSKWTTIHLGVSWRLYDL